MLKSLKWRERGRGLQLEEEQIHSQGLLSNPVFPARSHTVHTGKQNVTERVYVCGGWGRL